jgi:hypothetical protein
LLRPLFVPRLLLSPFVANNTLILYAGRGQFRLRHTFLAAMLAALILRTFQIVFLWHRDQTSFREKHFSPVNAARCRRVPSLTREEKRAPALH